MGVNKSKKLNRLHIPWEEMLETVNRSNKIQYDSVEKWLDKLYNQRCKGNVDKAAKIVGVSPMTMRRVLKRLGVIKSTRQERNKRNKEELFYKIPPEEMALMTKLEIIQKCDYCGETTFYRYIKKSGRKFKLFQRKG
jgi:hypothetical protein